MKPGGGGKLGREGGLEEDQKLKRADAQTRAAWYAPPAGGRCCPD